MLSKLNDKQKIPIFLAIISSDPITSNTYQAISSQTPINYTSPTRKRSGIANVYHNEPLPKSVQETGNFNICMYATSNYI
jgi:hypothetical protein